MVDVVYSVDSYATLVALAEQLGFGDGETIFIAGPINSGGSYMFNHVGTVMVPTGNTSEGPLGPQPEMQALPGVWGRLRLNGSTDFLSLIPAEAPLTLYRYVDGLGWTSDGLTPAPDYISTIGLIA